MVYVKMCSKVRVQKEEIDVAQSVMNLDDFKLDGDEISLKQELKNHLLLSNIVQEKISEHFVRAYDFFILRHFLLKNKNKNKKTENNYFLFILMELCNGGDVQKIIEKAEDKTLPLKEAAIPFLSYGFFYVSCTRKAYFTALWY